MMSFSTPLKAFGWEISRLEKRKKLPQSSPVFADVPLVKARIHIPCVFRRPTRPGRIHHGMGPGRLEPSFITRCRRRALSALLILAILGGLAPLFTGTAGAQYPPDTLQALDYALALFHEGDLYRAAGEAERFLFFHPKHDRTGEAKELLQRIREKTRLKEMSARGTTGSDAGGFVPWELSRPGEDAPGTDPGRRAGGGIMIGLVRFYQSRLRGFRKPGAACPSYPNCSTYALQAMRKHGALLGSFIYVDRFWREATTAGKPPFVNHRGRKLHYDPLEWNDYWLNQSPEEP